MKNKTFEKLYLLNLMNVFLWMLLISFSNSAWSVVSSDSKNEYKNNSLTEKVLTEITLLTNDFEQKPTFYIKCQLRFAMDCNELRRLFFEKFFVLERKDDDSAMIRVLLTDEQTNEGTIVHSAWSSNNEISVADFNLPELKLPKEFDTVKIQNNLITLLAQGVLPHIRVKSGQGLEDVIINSLQDPVKPPMPASGPFYVDINLSGMADKNGIGAKNPDGTPGFSSGNASFYSSVMLNHSTERTRILFTGDAGYGKETIPAINGTSYSSERFNSYIELLTVYSVTKNKLWNIAVSSKYGVDRANNLVSGVELGGGVEYNLVPFRVDQPYEFRVQAGYRNTEDHLVLVNGRNHQHENYSILNLRIYLYWLFDHDKMSLNSSLGGEKNISHTGYYNGSAYLNFQYHINDHISAGVGGVVGFTAKNMRFPGTPDFSNPLNTKYLSGYSGGYYQTFISINVNLGKGGTISSRDRRFR